MATSSSSGSSHHRPPLTRGYVLAIDPGLRAVGVAIFLDGALVRAGAVRGPKEGRGPRVWAHLGALVTLWVEQDGPGTCVVETMKRHVQGKADPDDLLELAGVGGAVSMALALRGWQVEGVKATEWNQVPAEIRRARSRAWVERMGWLPRVDLDTTQRFQQDVWSAVGIGRWRVTGSADG